MPAYFLKHHHIFLCVIANTAQSVVYNLVTDKALGVAILWKNIISHSTINFGGVSKSMLTLNEAIIDVKEG